MTSLLALGYLVLPSLNKGIIIIYYYQMEVYLVVPRTAESTLERTRQLRSYAHSTRKAEDLEEFKTRFQRG